MSNKARLKDAPIVKNEDGTLTVWFDYEGVDRSRTLGVSCGNKRNAQQLADRLRRAALAGAAVNLEADIQTDTGGKTYASCRCKVHGRQLNADLKALGF